MAEEIVSAMRAGRGINFKQRSMIAWTVYVLGWVVWAASMPMVFSYVDRFNQPGVPSRLGIPVVFMLAVSPAALWPLAPVAPTVRLEVACYYCGLVSCLVWPLWLRRKGGRLTRVARGGTLCLLVPWIEAARVLAAASHFPVAEGAPVLAVGSTLISLGVWLIPSPQKRENPGGADRKQYATSDTNRPSLVGATVLAAGWVLWLFALFLPGYYPAGAPAASLRMFGILRTLFLMDCRSIFPFHFSTGLLWSFPYFFGLLAAIFWSASPRVRVSPGFTVLLRILSMGLLAPLFRTAVILTKPPSGIVFYGFFALSTASALIFIGVWRIPPRLKCEKSAGENGKQGTTSNVNPDSGTGGT